MSTADQPSTATPIHSMVELHVQLLKLASLINRPMREGVSDPRGMAMDELKIIMCLGGEGPMAGHEITDVMAIPSMNVSRALKALKARGWIEQVKDPADKRRKPVQLSAAGLAAQRAMLPDLASVADYLLEPLTTNERASLVRTTAKIITRMESWARDHVAAPGLPE